jgi:hypothetical protein
MDESPKTFPTEPSATSAGKWIGRVMIAVLLGEGIWGLIVSLTNNLLLPFLARIMGADAQSPLYLGKGDFNVPALFISILELCFAGIVAAILYSWLQRKPTLVRSKSTSVRVSPIPEPPPAPRPSPAVVQVQATPPVTLPASPPATPSPAQFSSPPKPSPAAPALNPPPPKAKPEKPKPPKEVYYNIVGEPITPDDD